jgi:hypothetical protein
VRSALDNPSGTADADAADADDVALVVGRLGTAGATDEGADSTNGAVDEVGADDDTL